MRLMSFSLTTAAMRDKTKKVTRRRGWTMLKAGDRVMACEKVMGRRRGEPIVKIGEIEIVGVSFESLNCMTAVPAYGAAEVVLEGFPDMTPAEFVTMFCRTHKGSMGKKKVEPCTPATVVARIEFRHL